MNVEQAFWICVAVIASLALVDRIIRIVGR